MHPILFAAFPVLQLAAANVDQIDPTHILRPLLIVTASATALSMLVLLRGRRPHAAAFLLSVLTIQFFSYGHVYSMLKPTALGEIALGRHRYLVPAFIGLLAAGVWIVGRLPIRWHDLTPFMNTIGILLLIFPVLQIGLFFVRQANSAETAAQFTGDNTSTALDSRSELPDIYYIILDGHTRSDALLRDLGLDNSGFIHEMQAMGFYVADCARGNYEETLSSLIAALNMNYLSELRMELKVEGRDQGELLALAKESLVRRRLEALGYRTVAFQTGYVWSEIQDADLFLSLSDDPLLLQQLTAFESLLLETSAYRIWLDAQYLTLVSGFGAQQHPHRSYIELQQYILGQLPDIADVEGPTFTFAHILIPHVPYVFGPDGEIRTDPGFFGGPQAGPINEEYSREGYTGQVVYIDRRISNIVAEIIRRSDQPPIIIVQGDHGLRGHNRLQILNLYLFPDGGDSALYPTITPVNTFRVLFSQYFGASLELLPDRSFDELDESVEVKEPVPYCRAISG